MAPKSCGHVKGKRVVGREEAVSRIKAAVDARDEGTDILILARTVSHASASVHGLAVDRKYRLQEDTMSGDLDKTEGSRKSDPDPNHPTSPCGCVSSLAQRCPSLTRCAPNKR